MSAQHDEILKAAAHVITTEKAWIEATKAFDRLLTKATTLKTPIPTPTLDLHKEPAEPATPPNGLDPHSPKGKVLKQVKTRPKHVFSPADFADRRSNKLTLSQVYNALSDLTRKGYIERVAPGAYKLLT